MRSALVILLTACSTKVPFDMPDASIDDSGTDTGAACTKTTCNGTCVDTQTSTTACGGCGRSPSPRSWVPERTPGSHRRRRRPGENDHNMELVATTMLDGSIVIGGGAPCGGAGAYAYVYFLKSIPPPN